MGKEIFKPETTINITKNEFDLVVVHAKQTFPVKYIILASVCAAVILAVLIFTAIKRKKRKKA